MTTETMEVHLNSSANDVWGAVTAATTIFPRALRGLYQGIRTVSGDGFTAGSIRTITFGHRKYYLPNYLFITYTIYICILMCYSTD
ncbi:hypothetical protein LINPERPRIM_LOCUS40195 [Linum perenne]